MTISYITALSLLAILAIASYITLQKNNRSEETSAAIVNVSGRQRMLSQRIALKARMLTNGGSEEAKEKSRQELHEAINLMERSQSGLINGSQEMNLPGNPSLEIKRMLFSAPIFLDTRIQNYIYVARDFANLQLLNSRSDSYHLHYLTSRSNDLLIAIDALVLQYQSESEDAVKLLHMIEVVILILTLSLLIAIAVFIFRPMVRRLKHEASQLQELAITDPLTGLFNRRGLMTLSEKHFSLALRSKRNMTVIYVDMDGMKTINDKFGHNEGDQALLDIAEILKNSFRESDILARTGGDEFIVLLTEHTEPEMEHVISTSIQQGLITLANNRQRPYRLSLSIGIARLDPDNPKTIDELIAEADKAMYKNKQLKADKTLHNE